MYGVIYKITNLLNGKPYVGQTTRTIEERFKEHVSHNQYLIGKAIRKYGKENFSIEVLDECETQKELNERERFFIATLNCRHPNGYNLDIGGKGHVFTEEHKRHLSEAQAGERHHQFGKPLKEETKAKLSLALSGDKNPFYGRKHTDKTKAKISRALQGKPLSEETKAKLSAIGKGKPKSEETKAKMSASAPRKRPVICVELNEIYPSIAAAARCHDINYTSILRACKNLQWKSCGLHFQYLDEYQRSQE